MGQELSAAPDAEMPVERRHVLMGCRLAQAEASGDLLLGVTFGEKGERLPQPGRQLVGARFQTLAWRKRSLALSAVQRNDADGPALGIRYTDVS